VREEEQREIAPAAQRQTHVVGGDCLKYNNTWIAKKSGFALEDDTGENYLDKEQ
jgi:hypothetical protein